MKPRDRTSLQDIADQVHIIQQYLDGYTHDAFLNDLIRQDAVIRRFEIIGEAATRLSADFRDCHPEIPWQRIRAMRNFLSHVYDAVDLSLVWKTAQEDLPPLLIAVARVLAGDMSG
jgi:uncharacterized protein with HEPN domain